MIKYIVEAILWIIGKFSKSAFKIAYIAVLVGFFAFVSAGFVDAYMALTSFITNATHGFGIVGLDKFFGLLDCIGFYNALTATKLLLTTSLTFLVSIFIYSIYVRAMRFITEISSNGFF